MGGVSFKCPHCDQWVLSQRAMRDHFRDKHDITKVEIHGVGSKISYTYNGADKQMGEAKVKATKRREHATTIVTAFENFIDAAIIQHEYRDSVIDADIYMRKRELMRNSLIDILVTPPPV